MGQTLSEPVTSKETAICQNDFYKVRKKFRGKTNFPAITTLTFLVKRMFFVLAGHVFIKFVVFFYVQVGSSCMQGWRVSMEDSHTHILSVS